jgi:hypothetical protein
MNFLLQQAPADTASYMIAGYIVIFGVMLIYLASLAIRNRNLKQDLDVLQELDKENIKQDSNLLQELEKEGERPEGRQI